MVNILAVEAVEIAQDVPLAVVLTPLRKYKRYYKKKYRNVVFLFLKDIRLSRFLQMKIVAKP
jgi:hypothetical protein